MFIYTYLLKLANGDFYAGSCQNINQRLHDHEGGNVPSTKSFRPLKLVFYCAFPTKTQALKFERYLKSGSGKAFRNRHLTQVDYIRSKVI